MAFVPDPQAKEAARLKAEAEALEAARSAEPTEDFQPTGESLPRNNQGVYGIFPATTWDLFYQTCRF